MSALRRRGQPLAVLGFVLAGWIGVRAAVWEPPFALIEAPFAAKFAGTARGPSPTSGAIAQGVAEPVPAALPSTRSYPESFAPLRPNRAVVEPALPLAGGAREPLALAAPFAPVTAPPDTVTPHVAAAHQLLYLAALGQLPLPPGLALLAMPPRPQVEPSGVRPAALTTAAASRWSGDGWLLVRRGSGGLAAASGFPAYGASQAGGVIRFALAPNSPHAPQAYLRVSRAIGGFDEGEVAAGLSARPFANLPLRLLGEARVQRGSGVTRVRPAASLVSELPPLRLPLGIAGEAYAQVGYAAAALGAKRGATPFFDVQAVADRKLASAGPAELRLGAGAWSGGQNGVARLDLGPRASLRLATGPATSRLALDWRFRVAGNAQPASGPTLTFSAGF